MGEFLFDVLTSTYTVRVSFRFSYYIFALSFCYVCCVWVHVCVCTYKSLEIIKKAYREFLWNIILNAANEKSALKKKVVSYWLQISLFLWHHHLIFKHTHTHRDTFLCYTTRRLFLLKRVRRNFVKRGLRLYTTHTSHIFYNTHNFLYTLLYIFIHFAPRTFWFVCKIIHTCCSVFFISTKFCIYYKKRYKAATAAAGYKKCTYMGEIWK